MKTSKSFIFIIAAAIIISCKKNETTNFGASPSTNYTSVQDFLSKNAPAMQTYTLNATTGGSFTSPQGTKVTIPANAFVSQAGMPVIGIVTIQFKDLYKKSDMLLADMPTMMNNGAPLKSGGEFFIKVLSNNTVVDLATGKKITVSQPTALTGGADSAQQAFVGRDTMVCNGVNPAGGGNCGIAAFWVPTHIDTVTEFAQNYVFNLYQFKSPVDSGTWSNSDNPSFFSAYTQTPLTIVPQDNINDYGTNVFLVFKNFASMVHVYNTVSNSFPYNYAPQGLQCTVVALGIKGGKIYSAFVPITISANQVVHFTLSETTTSAFTAQLQTYN